MDKYSKYKYQEFRENLKNCLNVDENWIDKFIDQPQGFLARRSLLDLIKEGDWCEIDDFVEILKIKI